MCSSDLEGRAPGKILYYDGSKFTYLGSGDKGIKDGDIKVAEFNIPNHITLDKGNNLVFMDVDPSSNTPAHPNKLMIRKINLGSFKIPADNLSASFFVFSLDDNLKEDDETIKIEVLSVANAMEINKSVNLIIKDDDETTVIDNEIGRAHV